MPAPATTLKDVLFSSIGQYGAEVAVTEKFVYVRVPTDKSLAHEPGVDANGKPKVYHMQASTGGFIAIPGSDMRLSLNAGFRPDVMPAREQKATARKGK